MRSDSTVTAASQGILSNGASGQMESRPFPTGRTSRRPLPLASARSCMSDSERNESPMRRRSNPRDRITLEFLHGRNRVADQMASDHLERHLADSPRLVSRGPHDHRCSSILPGVKESARAPDPRPVAVPAAGTASKHLFGRRSGKGEDEFVIGGASLEEVDAPGDHRPFAAPLALGFDALAGTDTPDTWHTRIIVPGSAKNP